MINKLRFEGLSAELASLESLLDEARKYSDIVSTMQLEYKIDQIKKEVELYKNENTKAAVALFFSGKPVLGSRGINTDFTGTILKDFQDIVAKVNAKLTIGDIGSRGRVPNSSTSNLMITNISKGSFGFILEELTEQEEAVDTVLKFALDNVINYLTGIGSLNDEEYETILEKLDGRTLISIKDFFITLDQNGALLRLVEGNNDYSLDEEYIHRARTRAESIEIKEDEPIFTGKIIGVLPQHRKFEMLLEGDIPIYGSLDYSAVKQLNDFLENNENVVNESWTVKMQVRNVKPLNHTEKTFYTLISFLEKKSDI